ncbi:MAG: preprotein translocase subunit SecA [Pseudomonadota bacterium]
MPTDITALPPATCVLRPERADDEAGFLDRLAGQAAAGVLRLAHRRRAWMAGFISTVDGHGKVLAAATEGALSAETRRLRGALHRDGLRDDHVSRAFALIREIASRTLGKRHFDTQICGGRVLLKGMVAEMETGEGKTLTATLAAGTAALAGIPVHVITVNDYLTGRDADLMGPVYRALGLTVACVVHGKAPAARRDAYGADVCYCTNKEIAFDYLRDWIVLEGRPNRLRLQAEQLYGAAGRTDRLLLRGLHFGIVDEADSVLIDEARTPLIISRAAGGREEHIFMAQALELADRCTPGPHFRVDLGARSVTLTPAGAQQIREWAKPLGPLWTGDVRRAEIVRMALTARHLFRRDEHYLVREGKIQIVDEFTGRVMADRSYERGLQQLLEVKEGCEMTLPPETQARISYQRFFKRYLILAGMTGTAREVRRELWRTYGLSVFPIPTYRKMQRKAYPDRIFSTEAEKWKAVTERVREIHGTRRPILVGTRSVAASETAARKLGAMGLAHQMLNAKQDQEEAGIISRAGETGAVTIATNMAGRGTDIHLGPGVVDRGGLHVILTERHEAGRIDRQLAGRCGRLGDPGSFEAFVSLQDPILEGGRGGLSGWLARRVDGNGSPLWRWLARRAILNAQKKVERMHAKIRKALLGEDARRGDMLSFSGRSE